MRRLFSNLSADKQQDMLHLNDFFGSREIATKYRFASYATAFISLGMICSTAKAEVQAPNAHSQILTSAEDGFGSQLSDEQVGIYNSNFARGFSPKENGNILLEGMFYRAPTNISGFFEGNNIFVGVTAQSFPFAAPSGVVNYRLSKGRSVASFNSTASYTKGMSDIMAGAVVARLPAVKDRLLIATGASVIADTSPGAPGQIARAVFINPTLRLNGNLDIVSYVGRSLINNSRVTPYYYSTSGELPDVPRKAYTSPLWMSNNLSALTTGAMLTWIEGDWTLRAHGFYNTVRANKITQDLILIQAKDRASRQFSIDGPYKLNEPGGEIRISRAFNWSKLKGLTLFSWRAYKSNYKETTTANLFLNDYEPGTTAYIEDPNYDWTEEFFYNRILKSQSLGLSQSFFYADIIESNISLRRLKTNFLNDSKNDATPLKQSSWLPSASVSANIANGLHLYTSYTRGMMDSVIAPNYAENAGELLPPNITKQWDIGLRWKPQSGGTLILAYFDITRPYHNLDEDDIYRALGRYGNKGVEISYSRWIGQNLYILGSAMLAPARIRNLESGERIKNKRLSGISDHRGTFYALYNIPEVKGLSLSLNLDFNSSKLEDVRGARTQSGQVDLGFGVRYNMRVRNSLLSLRVSGNNLINQQKWYAAGSDFYIMNSPRTFAFTASASF